MKIAALLAWYSESPEMLERTVRSMEKAGVSYLIALDGRYVHYPSQTTNSTTAERCAIKWAARESGIKVAIHEPEEPWPTEMEKRTAMFRLAENLDADWWLILDADEQILQVPEDLNERLSGTHHDSAEVTEMNGPAKCWSAIVAEGFPHAIAGRLVGIRRCFFKAIPGIEVVGKHWRYMTPDGRELWGPESDDECLALPDFIIDHRQGERSPERMEEAQAYYAKRDELGIETTNPVLAA